MAATVSRAESKDMYSWWWDSHISPKNSKWLQENLTEMDAKVRMMIKLIEVDEDSFARRAEMYYKKRPELMKLVEEFYRAFRALAERYDHATGVIKQAHKTMAETFPNQVPFVVPDDGPFSSIDGSYPHTPAMSVAGRSFFDPDYFHSGERNGAFGPQEEVSFSKLSEGRARKCLDFHDADQKEVQIRMNDRRDQETQVLSESERIGRSESDIQELKEALARLEAEKQAGLLQYQESFHRFSNLESEVSRAQEDSRGLHERASKAEAEVQSLKESLAKLEGERETSLHQYQQCLNRISNLESNVARAMEDTERLDKQASKAEKEAQVLREELAQLKAEKEAGLAKYMEALEQIANLENKLLLAEDKAIMTSERAYKAEREVAALMEALNRATEEKEAAALQYQQCLEKIVSLESEIALSREQTARLKDEIDHGAAKLKVAEEQCLLLERSNKSMQGELDSVLNKLTVQNQELSEKQRELGRLWTCVQEERLRFVEVETAFRALQNLHSQTQEELRSAAAELQKRVQLLKDTDIHNQSLQHEVQKIRDENKVLSELNLSSTVSIKDNENEILNLKEGRDKLEGELELELNVKNALQQEIYSLKEELNVLNKKHQAMVDQVELVGFQPECFGLSVTDLQYENSKLKERCQRSESEISVLLEKLGVMEKLIEKKAVLECSLCKLNAELEDARGKVRALEESYQLLMNDKSTVIAEKAILISQLESTTGNLEKLSAKNSFLQNSLFDANAELEALRKKSKNFEDSCRLLNYEKTILLNEKQSLNLKLETAHQRLEELGKRHEELEQKFFGVEEERESALKLVEDLWSSLAAEKQGHETSDQLRNKQMAEMENKILLLQEMGEHARGQLEEELDKAINSQFEICVLQNILQDLKETNSSLLNKCEKLLEASKLSEKLISELAYENIEQQEEVDFLSEQIKRLRMGMFQLLKVLDIDLEHVCEENLDEDQMILRHIFTKLDGTRSSLCKAWDENHKLLIEKSVLEALLGQLKQEVADLKALINTLQLKFRTGNDQVSSLQKDMHKLLQYQEELILRVREGNHREEFLVAEVENLRSKLLEVQGACQDLEKENCGILEEKGSLMKAVQHLDEEKHKLEHENSCLVVQAVTLDTLSSIFKSNVLERSEVINQLAYNFGKLCGDNNVLENKVILMESKLDKYKMENMDLKGSIEKLDYELKEVKTTNSQLKLEIASEKDQLSQKEMELLELVIIKEDQRKQIIELTERYNQQLKKIESLGESVQNAGAEVCRILKKQNETDRTMEMLRSELNKGKAEAELWETVAGTFFTELQTSSVREALFREKFSELTREYERLEDENYSKGLEVVQLQERVGSLEGESSQVKAQLAGYIPALASLRDSVASLESHAMHAESENDYDKDVASSHDPSEDEAVATVTSDGFSGLQDVAVRIKAVENKVIEMKRLNEERSLKALKSQSSRSRRGSARSSRRFPSRPMEELPANRHHRHSTKQQKQASHPYEVGELLVKDIMLDQASETSSHGKNRRGRYKNSQSDDQILELWETVDQAGSIDLTVGKTQKETRTPPKGHYHCLEAVKEHNKSGRSSESQVEKELGVDMLEISKRFIGPTEEESNRKILDRLTYDVQKLANLQITVQDLKHKVVITESSNPTKGKGIEYMRIKEQLEETDRAIVKLLDVSGKLMKNLEDCSPGSPMENRSPTIGDSSGIGGSRRRRKVSDQVRRCSEKTGRLQLEVQKFQLLLLKLDGSNRMGRGTGPSVAERNTRILLKDYLYGGTRTPRRRKKAHFCGCVNPPTTTEVEGSPSIVF